MNILAVILLALVSAVGGYFYGESEGRSVEKAYWVDKDRQRVSDEKVSILAADEKNKNAEKIRNAQIKIERDERESKYDQLKEKYDKVIADGRLNRSSGGLRVSNSICDGFASGIKVPGASGDVKEEGARLPRNVEEALYRFAEDRDKIIIDFESFKNEVRISKCFAG